MYASDLNGNSAILTFKNIANGFTPQKNLEWFEACGEDGIFKHVSANVILPEKTIEIKSDNIDEIIAIRYCFKNFVIGKVHNTYGFPLIPFRTDK